MQLPRLLRQLLLVCQQVHLFNETVRKWIELARPRGKLYSGKLIVMVSRWTGRKGIAIGFDAMKRGKVIGTKMAGLIGAIYIFEMPETKIGYSIPLKRCIMLTVNQGRIFYHLIILVI